MALQTFPLPYKFEVDKEKQYATKTVVFESNKKQIQQLAIKPIVTWKINVKGTPEQLTTLESFFDSCSGNARNFLFIDEWGNNQTVRFADNKLTYKEFRDFNTGSKTNGFVVGFDATLTLESVI